MILDTCSTSFFTTKSIACFAALDKLGTLLGGETVEGKTDWTFAGQEGLPKNAEERQEDNELVVEGIPLFFDRLNILYSSAATREDDCMQQNCFRTVASFLFSTMRYSPAFLKIQEQIVIQLKSRQRKCVKK